MSVTTNGSVGKVAETDPDFYFRTAIGNDGDVNWEHLLAPAPVTIAIISQVMICAYRVKDFEIDHKPGSLMRHPESFRTSLVQIGNDAYVAFRKAHSNMERISLEMAQVPTRVGECAKILKSGNKTALEKLMPRRLSRIQEAAENGSKLSQEIVEGFDQLTELICQVLEATSASSSAKEKKIEDVKKSTEMSRQSSREAERRLEITKKQFDRFETEMKKVNEQHMQVFDVKAIKTDRDRAILLLSRGLIYLRELKEHWARIAQCFQSIQDKIKTATAYDGLIALIIENSILESSQTCYMTHRIADMYVKVSNRYIMNNVAGMAKLMAIEDREVEKAHQSLVASCQEASDGILQMARKDKIQNQRILQIQEQNNKL